MTSNYVETLSADQAAWCAAKGIRFIHNAKHRISHFVKGTRFVDVDWRSATRPVFVSRRPTVELDGPDCNDGENVDLAEFTTLRAALVNLAAVSS